MWKTVVCTDSYIYIIGKYCGDSIIGKFAKDNVPPNINNIVNVATYLENSHRHRYLRPKNMIPKIYKDMNDFPIIKTDNAFTCKSCNIKSQLMTPLSCLHSFCSSCVANMMAKSKNCTECETEIMPNIEWKRENMYGLNYTFLVKALRTIGITDNSPINLITSIV